jgi:hypothetical protein
MTDFIIITFDQEGDRVTSPMPADESIVDVRLADGSTTKAWYSCDIMESGDWDFVPVKGDEPDMDADSIADQVVAWRPLLALQERPICAREGRCNHYNGIMGPGMKDHPTCDAGVNYRALAGTSEPGWVRKLPCYSKTDESVECEKRTLPTPEQIAAWNAYCDERLSATGQAMKACRDDAAGRKGIRGEIECPICKGRLAYTVAASNGHLWGRCSTPECVSWMQ